MTLLKRLGTAAVLLALVSTPVMAQQVSPASMRQAARTACLGGDADDCQAAVQAYIDALKEVGVVGANLDNALVSFASSLSDAAVRLPATVREVVSNVIRTTITVAMTDRTQVQQLLALADNVSTGTQTQSVAQIDNASDE